MKVPEWINDIISVVANGIEKEEILVDHDGRILTTPMGIVQYIYNKALQAACEEIKAIQEAEKRDETRLWPPDNMPWDYPEDEGDK